MTTFKPSMTLPTGQFSDWHFMILKREDYHWHYDKPVIVLCDEKCISTMASFRPRGDTFEGKNVAVDVPAHSKPEDFITGRDRVLEQALQKLLQ